MPAKNKIYDSAPAQPEDNFWLKQGEKMVEESLSAVREAARAMMTGLGLLQSVYLAIYGFTDGIPSTPPSLAKFLSLLPIGLWLFSLYYSLEVMMTRKLEINRYSPDDIRSTLKEILLQKQSSLQKAFWGLATGIVIALALLLYR